MAQSKVGCPLAEKIRETEEVLKRPKKILVRKAKSCLILACKRKLCVRLIAVSKRAKRRKRKHPSCPAPFLSWIPPIMHHSYSVSLFCPSFLLSFKPPVLHLSNPICLLPSCPVFLPHVLPYICLFCIHPVLHTVHCTVYTLSCTASVLPPFCLASFLNCFNPVLISECPACLPARIRSERAKKGLFGNFSFSSENRTPCDVGTNI